MTGGSSGFGRRHADPFASLSVCAWSFGVSRSRLVSRLSRRFRRFGFDCAETEVLTRPERKRGPSGRMHVTRTDTHTTRTHTTHAKTTHTHTNTIPPPPPHTHTQQETHSTAPLQQPNDISNICRASKSTFRRHTGKRKQSQHRR
jgi:hypothetical protein